MELMNKIKSILIELNMNNKYFDFDGNLHF